MILVINDSATENEVEKIKEELNSLGCRIYELIGLDYHILGILEIIDPIILKKIEENKAVEKSIPLEAAQIKATRLYKSEDTMLNINNHQIGGNKLGIIAGPCSVESEKQILSIARDVKKAGANLF
ncbi:hypothetical protein P7M25_26525, partial [Vibrio parahaemolyticus]|nr:hypothetical protein [Vibrio parahaemolyticus]